MEGEHVVAVGSENPVKLECVRLAFEAVWPTATWSVRGISVDSGVSEQPLGEVETIEGAHNRAQSALLLGGGADFAVGLEGGVMRTAGRLMECGYIVVLNKDKVEGIASTAKIIIPANFHTAMVEGKTLSEVCDAEFGTTDVGQDVGYFGLMTNNAVTRTSAYRDAVAFALAIFAQPQLFTKEIGAVGD